MTEFASRSDDGATGDPAARGRPRVLITGACRGIGHACAKAFAAEGAELILATTKHHVSGEGALAGVGRLAGTWVLPPTLTAQYHFLPDGAVRPYVGAGINYTIFYNTKATGALNSAIGKTKVGLSDSVGWAGQAGIDIDVTKKIFVNLDAKYIRIRTHATLTTGTLVNRERVHLDPLVLGVGIGTRF